jgi:NAD(P)-dependent dehydrogenase (short-subunit alcohol dehydrogenase family)
MGKLDGKVAFITGAARGQGRSHAIRLADDGADIIAVDACVQVDSVEYPMSTLDDLAETVKLVGECGRRVVSRRVDVRGSCAVGLTDPALRGPAQPSPDWVINRLDAWFMSRQAVN